MLVTDNVVVLKHRKRLNLLDHGSQLRDLVVIIKVLKFFSLHNYLLDGIYSFVESVAGFVDGSKATCAKLT
jgi:hypothetical protein